MSRRLYLMRHAEAAPGSPDRQRPLTPAGRKQAETMANLLRRMNIRPAKIWHSARLRAVQTAQIVAATLPCKARALEQPGLEPDSRVKPAVRAIGRSREDLLIVGHEPHMGKLATRLLTGRKTASPLTFAKGAVACLAAGKTGRWTLEWLVTAEIAACCEPGSAG